MDLNSMIELAQFQTDSYHAAVDRAAAGEYPKLAAWFKSQHCGAYEAGQAIQAARSARIPDFTPGAGSTPTEPSSEPRRADAGEAGEVEALAQRIVSYQ